ncbi:uncharacterized protein LOC129241938 [Anastrepha obliqua]|uniref:uncharacterized protein LOC129241938 n=1 Tax=Anastrepha obliqua TaxID=95512 RepID=UPI00240A1AA9|nr:uncharacterized protein LOC129241938 [Anastrepha obliqua]
MTQWTTLPTVKTKAMNSNCFTGDAGRVFNSVSNNSNGSIIGVSAVQRASSACKLWIEVDPEITKPLNLANSAVLRAVEEEEQMKCDLACERQSRSRQRRQHPPAPKYYEEYYEQAMHTPVHQQQLEQIKTQYLCHQHNITIDRDTVLKINRLATRKNLHKRDHSWPPPNSDYAMDGEAVAGGADAVEVGRGGTQSLTHSRSSSKEQRQHQQHHHQQQTNSRSSSCSSCNNNAVHFAESVCKRHGIDAIREKFNSPTRIIEPTPAELRQRNKMEQMQLQKQKLQKTVKNKLAHGTDSSRETRANVCTVGTGASQQTLTNVHNNSANISSVNAALESFSVAIIPNVATTTSWPAAMNMNEIGGELTNVTTTTSDYDALDDCNTPMARGFSAPETKAADEYIGLVEPRRYYFEQLARHEFGTPKKWHSYENIATATGARQQFTTENTTAAAINNNRQSQSLDRGRKQQQQRRREELPPLKPRSCGIGGGGTASGGNILAARITPPCSVTEVNVMACNSEGPAFSSGQSCVTRTTPPTFNQSKTGGSTSPRVQRRAIKLATEIKICYNDMDADEVADAASSYRGNKGDMCAVDKHDLRAEAVTAPVRAAEQQNKPRTYLSSEKASGGKSIKKRQSSDLEHIPLPPTPQVGKEEAPGGKQPTRCKISDFGSTRTFELQGNQKQIQHQHQQQPQTWNQHRRSSSESNLKQQPPHSARIIPIELEQQSVAERMGKKQAPPRRDLSTVSADQLYDDACIYLRSIDLDDRTVAYIPAAITIVPSLTDEISQQRTAGDQSQNLKAGIVTRRALEKPRACSTGTSAPISPTPQPPVTQRNSSHTITSVPRQILHKKAAEKNASKMPITAASGFDGHDDATTNESVKQSIAGSSSNRKNINNQCANGSDNMQNMPTPPNKAHSGHATHATQSPVYKIFGQLSGTEQPLSNTAATRNRQPQQQLKVVGKVSENKGTTTKMQVGQHSQQRQRSERPRGIYYTDGEYLYGPFGELAGECETPSTSGMEAATSDSKQTCVDENEWQMSSKEMKTRQQQKIGGFFAAKEEQHARSKRMMKATTAAPTPVSDLIAVSAPEQQKENAAEIAALEAKYGLFQQSIAEHLKQIDTYMENAKVALNRSLPQQKLVDKPKEVGEQEQAMQQRNSSQQPILHKIDIQPRQIQLLNQQVASTVPPLESPLQTLARQLVHKQAMLVVSANDDNLQAIEEHRCRLVQENMPVVEQALQDLSAVKVDDTQTVGKVAPLVAKHVQGSGGQIAVDGSVLQPLMQRLIAAPTIDTTTATAPSTTDRSDTEEVLAVEHHFMPTAAIPKRVTILENLDDVIAATGRKPTNIVLIEMDDDDKVHNVNDKVALVNDKVDDNNNCAHLADDSSINDTAELEKTETNSEVVETSENQNFENFSLSSKGSAEIMGGRVDIIEHTTDDRSSTRVGAKATTNVKIPITGEATTSICAAPEHVVDVVANYEQLGQLQQFMPKATTATSMKHELKHKQSLQQQQQQRQAYTKAQPDTRVIAATTKSAPTTPVSRRRTTSIAVDESTTSKTTTPQKQEQHARLQKQVPQPPIPPPLPTPPFRAGSLPKDLCKNVVSGYISTHQSQEQLVEQVYDMLQLETTLHKEKEVKLEQEQHNQLRTGVNTKTSNQNRDQNALVGEQQQAALYETQQLNQQQSAILPITKSKRKSSSSAASSNENVTALPDTKSACNSISPASAAVTALATQKSRKQVIAGRRGKLTLHIQDNAKSASVHESMDTFDTYKATYEIPSPYFKQHIAWQSMVDGPQKIVKSVVGTEYAATTDGVGRLLGDNEVQIDAVSHTIAQEAISDNTQSRAPLQSVKQQSTTSRLSPVKPFASEHSRSRSASPRTNRQASRSPIRKYPAALIEPHALIRAASPFGLNPLDIAELIDGVAHNSAAADAASDGEQHKTLKTAVGAPLSSTSTVQKNLGEFVPQLEGHNVGLLVRAPISSQTQQEQAQQQQQKIALPTMGTQNVGMFQIETDNALTHSAVTHYVDAEASTDDDDGDVKQQQCTVGIKLQRQYNKTHRMTTPTPTSTPFNTSVSSSSLSSSAHCARARSLHSMVDKKAHDPEPSATIEITHDIQTHAHTATNTQTHAKIDSSATDLTCTATGKLQMPVQGYHGQQQQQEVVLGDDSQQQSLDMIGKPAVALHHQCTALPRDSGIINRSFDNVSPRPYITVEGYKRVAWPPVSEERVVREFTPQPTSAHYPVSGQQQPAEQHQPQHLQQQQQPSNYQQQQPNAAPANQGPIYNNVSRATRQNSPYPGQQQPLQQSYQQSPLQQPQPQQQHYEPPIQYTQAQFNRQPSHEPAGPPYGQPIHETYGQPQQQQQYPLNYTPEQQYPQQHCEPSSTSAWKPIRAPVPKTHNEFVISPVRSGNAEPFYPSYGQQQQQQQQPTQQYRATSYDQYHPQPQQYQPHQGSQPPFSQQPHYQPQQQQQQPSWAHNQPAQQYQPVQAPYPQAPPQQQQQYQAPPPSNYQSQPYHQQQYQAPPQQQQYSSVPQTNQYNSYSQPQQHLGQDQPDRRAPVQQQQAQPLPQDYRGGSPGIITLRKEAPVTQKPAPVYNAQPAAISFQGGSKMRGDLKWPPPEYKEAAVRANEERRQLALGPVCRPRKVNRDYSPFFAKNALNSYYPSYKVPPGTQHMLA